MLCEGKLLLARHVGGSTPAVTGRLSVIVEVIGDS